MKRNVFFLAFLCCVGLLGTASPIQAQRGGGYHGGYGYGYGGVGFYGGYNPYGYGYDPFYYGPRYLYDYPPPAVVIVGGPAGAAVAAPPSAALSEGAPRNAQIKVLLSDPQAKVWFDGIPTNSTGTERLYHTPDLPPGATITYRIRAAWNVSGKEVVQERAVPVAPGRGSVADFTRPLSELLPPPPTK